MRKRRRCIINELILLLCAFTIRQRISNANMLVQFLLWPCCKLAINFLHAVHNLCFIYSSIIYEWMLQEWHESSWLNCNMEGKQKENGINNFKYMSFSSQDNCFSLIVMNKIYSLWVWLTHHHFKSSYVLSALVWSTFAALSEALS